MYEAFDEARKKHAGIPAPHHTSGRTFAYGTGRPGGQVPIWSLIAANRLLLSVLRLRFD